MKLSLLITGLLLGSFFILSCSEDTPSGRTVPPNQPPAAAIFDWTRQDNFLSATLYDVFFVNSSQGWAVGEEGTLLSTSNGGTSWPQPPSALTDEVLRSVFIVDEQTGWIVGQPEGEDEGGQVFQSRQGGAYPEPQTRSEQPLNTIVMLDAQRGGAAFGWAAGARGLLLHTTDGGTSWDTTTVAEGETILALHFLDPARGWLVTDRGSIFHTEDGQTWQREITPDTTALRSVHFGDEATGWACGDRGVLLRRTVGTDGTSGWERIRIGGGPEVEAWNDIFLLDAKRGWIVGEEGNIFHTRDGGMTWERQTSNFRTTLNAVYMVSDHRGWAVGEDGVILTYTP